ncbi:hypothetical protein A6V29_11530 [Blastococcus sp. CCUG 61487]|nr:hypothetical protein A6V29_11530 [Blastococcus sp. CCUG 61487]
MAPRRAALSPAELIIVSVLADTPGDGVSSGTNPMIDEPPLGGNTTAAGTVRLSAQLHRG